MYLALLLGLLAHLSTAPQQDPVKEVQEWDYYTDQLDNFELRTDEEISSVWSSRGFWMPGDEVRRTRIVFEGEGEGYLTWRGSRQSPRTEDLFLTLKVPKGAKEGARLVIGNRYEPRKVYQIRWGRIEKNLSAASFYEIKGTRYDRLVDQGYAGSAWFRLQAELAWETAEELRHGGQAHWGERHEQIPRRTNTDGPADEFALFSSGRAVAENLRLDRILETDLKAKRDIPITELGGLNIDEIDWAPRLEGLKPKLDPSADWIPINQYAVVFPSLSTLTATLDEASQSGTPVLNLLDPRSVDAGTRDFYLRQLCIDQLLENPGKWEHEIQDITITGSDPFFRTGTDVALLIRTESFRELGEMLEQHQLQSGAKSYPGTLIKGRDWHYECVRSDDRKISSYVSYGDGMVVVSNSVAQMERVADAFDGTLPKLSSAPEYVYFRHQYPIQANSKQAFLILTDPAIRRWGNPKWRIGAARRIQAGAVMYHQRAEQILAMIGQSNPSAHTSMPDVGEYGNWEFQTPILELDIDMVSALERDQYQRFRNRYQRAWREAFDPIAAILTIHEGVMDLDITIEPLVRNSEYWDFLSVCLDAELPSDAGDIHSQALVHLAMAINKESSSFGSLNSISAGLMPGMKTEPFSWVGDSLSIYFDDSPFWADLANAENKDEFISDNIHRLPFGLDVAVEDRLRLVAFLTGLRALVAQVDPGSPPWVTHKHGETSYVEIMISDDSREFLDAQLRLFYVILPGHLVFSLRQEVIHAAIDRQNQLSEEESEYRNRFPWKGKTMSLAVTKGGLQTAPMWMNTQFQDSSWRNIMILNEWKHYYPDRDPVEVHAELWGEKLLCPGGGVYQWNNRWQTMESSIYGCPEQARGEYQMPPALDSLKRADFGLTMKGDSLRAQVSVHR